MAEWKVRIRGKQRKNLDVALVIQAVIALGKQLAREEGERAAKAAVAGGEQSAPQTTGSDAGASA